MAPARELCLHRLVRRTNAIIVVPSTSVREDMSLLTPHSAYIIRRLQDIIFKDRHGRQSFGELRAQLHLQCVDGRRTVTEQDFKAIMTGTGLLSEEDSALLFGEIAGSQQRDGGKVASFAEVRHDTFFSLGSSNHSVEV